ncbi:MAG: hypothetical protein ACRECQ_12530 [Burkholderiaceae bacterium]
METLPPCKDQSCFASDAESISAVHPMDPPAPEPVRVPVQDQEPEKKMNRCFVLQHRYRHRTH